MLTKRNPCMVVATTHGFSGRWWTLDKAEFKLAPREHLRILACGSTCGVDTDVASPHPNIKDNLDDTNNNATTFISHLMSHIHRQHTQDDTTVTNAEALSWTPPQHGCNTTADISHIISVIIGTIMTTAPSIADAVTAYVRVSRPRQTPCSGH